MRNESLLNMSALLCVSALMICVTTITYDLLRLKTFACPLYGLIIATIICKIIKCSDEILLNKQLICVINGYFVGYHDIGTEITTQRLLNASINATKPIILLNIIACAFIIFYETVTLKHVKNVFVDLILVCVTAPILIILFEIISMITL